MQKPGTFSSALLALAIFLTIPFFNKAQNQKLDSLAKITETLEDTDTMKVYNYCDIALKYGHLSEFDKAFVFTKKAELIVDKINHKRNKALVNYVAGYINYSKLNYKEALAYLLSAVKLYEELDNKKRLAACYTVIAFIYQDQTFYDKAELYLQKTLTIRLELQDSMRLPGTYSNIGLNFYKLSQKKKNLTLESYEIREAIKNFETAIEIARRQRLPDAGVGALGNLSNIMNDLKRFPEALLYAQRAMKIYNDLGDTYQETVSLIDIGSVYFAQNKFKEAIPYFQRSLEISLNNNYEELERYSYSNLWRTNEEMGNYKEAFHYLYKEKSLHDSVFNKENLKQINEMQIKYESEKKESENALLIVKNELSDKAIKNQKNIIIFSVGGLVLTLFFLFFIFRGLSRQKEANRIISKQKQEVEAKNVLINTQKEMLEDKQKEILDSINYARRIQRAHLPTEKYITKSLDRLKN